jgi:hypothetical protein
VGGREYKVRVLEVEYGGNITYSYMTMRKGTCWNYSKNGVGEIKERVNLTKIYCKHFVNVTMYPKRKSKK